MGKFLDRVRSRSLSMQGGSGIFSGRTQPAMGGSIQQMIFDFRSTIHDKVNEVASADGIVQRGMISNIIPNLRATRLVPEPTATETPPVGMQMYPRDVELLNTPASFRQSRSLQKLPPEVELLGSNEIYIY